MNAIKGSESLKYQLPLLAEIVMKGGKGGRKRKGSAGNDRQPVKIPSPSGKKQPSTAPKKGARKKPEFGGSSSSSDE
jgi:hypothetical protein